MGILKIRNYILQERCTVVENTANPLDILSCPKQKWQRGLKSKWHIQTLLVKLSQVCLSPHILYCIYRSGVYHQFEPGEIVMKEDYTGLGESEDPGVKTVNNRVGHSCIGIANC